MKTSARSCCFSGPGPAGILCFAQRKGFASPLPCSSTTGPLRPSSCLPMAEFPGIPSFAPVLGTLQALFARPRTLFPLPPSPRCLTPISPSWLISASLSSLCSRSPSREAYPCCLFTIADLPPIFLHQHFLPPALLKCLP